MSQVANIKKFSVVSIVPER